jgi:hypothetical protein
MKRTGFMKLKLQLTRTGADYIRTRRDIDDGRPQTPYVLSAGGRRAFERYVDALQVLLKL